MNGNLSPIQYTALGDSLTVGVGADLFSPGFVLRYGRDAERALGQPVFIEKIAKNGATSGEILHALDVPQVAYAVRSSKIITITAGGNDLIDAAERYLIDRHEAALFKALDTATANIHRMIDRIHAIHNPTPHQYILRLLNLYNPFPGIPQADLWIKRFNSGLAGFTAYPHIKIADIYSAFQGRQSELLKPFGVHPNDRGYAVMADVLDRLGYDHIN